MEVGEGSRVGRRRTRAQVMQEAGEEESSESDDEEVEEEVPLRRRRAVRVEAPAEQPAGGEDQGARIRALEAELQASRVTIAVRDQHLLDERARADELRRERDTARREAAHHGARAAYYYVAYRGVVPPGQGLPDYSVRAGRSEGAVQPPDKRQAPPPGPAPAAKGGSQT